MTFTGDIFQWHMAVSSWESTAYSESERPKDNSGHVLPSVLPCEMIMWPQKDSEADEFSGRYTWKK